MYIFQDCIAICQKKIQQLQSDILGLQEQMKQQELRYEDRIKLIGQ